MTPPGFAWCVAGLASGLALVPVTRGVARRFGWELLPPETWLHIWPHRSKTTSFSYGVASLADEDVPPPPWSPGTEELMLEAARGEGPRALELQDMYNGTSPLVRVIAAGETRIVGNVAVDLLSLELRELSGGGVMVIRAPRVERPPSRVVQVGPFMRSPRAEVDWMPRHPELHVADDVGTHYEAFLAGGGGDDASYRCEFRFWPAPPPPATRLTVTVRRIRSGFPTEPPGHARKPYLVGPWSFEVALA